MAFIEWYLQERIFITGKLIFLVSIILLFNFLEMRRSSGDQSRQQSKRILYKIFREVTIHRKISPEYVLKREILVYLFSTSSSPVSLSKTGLPAGPKGKGPSEHIKQRRVQMRVQMRAG